MLNLFKANIVNGSHGIDKLMNRSIVMVEQHTFTKVSAALEF